MDSFPRFQDIVSGIFWTPSPPSLSMTIWIRVPVLEFVFCLKFVYVGLIFGGVLVKLSYPLKMG